MQHTTYTLILLLLYIVIAIFFKEDIKNIVSNINLYQQYKLKPGAALQTPLS